MSRYGHTTTAIREYAARTYPCPTCGKEPGRRCLTNGRPRRPHPARYALLDADLPGAAPCPSTSPETQAPCDLPDLASMHYLGHQSRPTPHLVSWPTSPDEHARWGSNQ